MTQRRLEGLLCNISGGGGIDSPKTRRNTYRGESLGTSLTAEQKAVIAAGTFDDMYIGDYWTIGGIVYRIADMDYWYNNGNPAFTKHHLVIVPDAAMYNSVMNDTDTATDGYAGSKMHTSGLDAAKTTIGAAFGSALLTHREYLSNMVANNLVCNMGWYDSTVDIMNEIMVYGSYIFAAGTTGQVLSRRDTISRQQLSLFRLDPTALNRRENIWLRDVAAGKLFAYIDVYGFSGYLLASNSFGVRPAFAIG